MKGVNFTHGNFGVTKDRGKYITVYGDSELVAYILPYTTRFQAKKLAKRMNKHD
jgi:hypothetical protein